MERLAEFARGRVRLGIITVPADQAQTVADMMVEAGIRVIWNFAPRELQVPPHVLLVTEDLAVRLAVLSYLMTSR
jgi:redox-sensing transcriptional repressor